MKHEESTFSGVGGLELFYQSWQPEEPARATLIIVHGLGEHGGRYMNLVNPLVSKGYAIYALDHRGFGRSPGKKGFVNDWSEYREDLRIFVELVREKEGERPFFLFGHSMGGCMTCDYVLHYPDGLTGVILSAPAVGKLDVPTLLAVLSAILSKIAPGVTVSTGLDASTISRDPAAVEAYINDPLVHDKGTPRLGTELPKTALRNMEHAAEFKPPLLMIHGEADGLVNVENTRQFFAKVTQPDKKLIIYEGGYHESHNDIHHAQVAADIEAWLEAHLTVEEVESAED